MTTLKLYNTKSRSKEEFRPIDSSNVRMYVCGPTVYDRAHIGNARPVVIFDVLYRLLKIIYDEKSVIYVRNITDVDDKIISRALEENRSVLEITNETIEWFHSDNKFLNILPPTHEPRATEFINEMISMIKKLINRGNAYILNDGQVLFSVKSFADYGTLSNQSLNDMIAGNRVEIDERKKDPLDFVLWKPTESSSTGWDSPWGFGRPGWHIECSAMTTSILGTSFDIHGGGIDLIFPHHENELAQSLCANETNRFANFWLHNGFVNIEGQKMSKSLGNFLTVDDLRQQKINGDVVRLVLMSSHYRQPLDWSDRKLSETSNTIAKWQKITKEFTLKNKNIRPMNEVLNALKDDLNTPLAITELHNLVKKRNYEGFINSARFLGLLLTVKKENHASSLTDDNYGYIAIIDDMLNDRKLAREQKDYKKSDSIRVKLEKAGVIIKDTSEGTTWDLKSFFDPNSLRRKT